MLNSNNTVRIESLGQKRLIAFLYILFLDKNGFDCNCKFRFFKDNLRIVDKSPVREIVGTNYFSFEKKS